MGLNGARPTIDLELVERVTMFDASHEDLGAVLSQRSEELPRMRTAGGAGWAPGAIHLFDITAENTAGLPGQRFDASAMRGIFYVRLVENALALGRISAADLATLKSEPEKDVLGATRTLLAAIPTRGTFSTRSPTPAGKTDLAGFLKAHAQELALVDDAQDGLSSFVLVHDLDMGHRFDANPRDAHRTAMAHHWIPSELGHEAAD